MFKKIYCKNKNVLEALTLFLSPIKAFEGSMSIDLGSLMENHFKGKQWEWDLDINKLRVSSQKLFPAIDVEIKYRGKEIVDYEIIFRSKK